MYIEAMESVLDHTNNVLVDVKGGNNVMYLPLDKLNAKAAEALPAAPSHEPVAPVSTPPVKETKPDSRATSRDRDVRGR
jgi:membrane protease subunit HflK